MSFVVDSSKQSVFKILLENISDINNQINITLRKDHLYLQGMDPSHVCLFELKLADKWFQEYIVEKDITVGLDINVVNKIIACCGKTQSIQFQTDAAADKILINLINGKGSDIDKSFETTMYDFDVELLNITDIDSDIDISINSHLLSSLVEQIAVFGDSLRFECNDDGITLISKENKLNTEMNCKIDIDKISNYSTTDEAVINEYSIMYYSKLCKYAKLMNKDANVDIQIAADSPLIMKYDLSGEKKEEDAYECDTDDDEGGTVIRPHSVMMLCLAPKVVDEDFE
jgi:proliferating cell nuclear antigen PCNA